MIEKEDGQDVKDRASRVRRLREKLNLSRADLKKKYAISVATLQGWEDPRWGNLTDKGAKRLVKAYEQEGFQVTVEWLMYGIGPDPLLSRVAESGATYQVQLTEQAIIAQELRLFYQYNSNAIDMIIQDDAMLPCLAPGDHVAGKRFFDQDLKHALGLPCLIQTQAGALLVRKVGQGSEPDTYTLTGTHTGTAVEQNIKLFSAAPIIWIRKPSVK
jgi:transcriptional regulator with XRE-family HTH domain